MEAMEAVEAHMGDMEASTEKKKTQASTETIAKASMKVGSTKASVEAFMGNMEVPRKKKK